ncbi:hypothetical protein PG996_004189 [Apiospora saccharicola]|uniref:Uncharacterized protein n=1 Tax=Apiospora saccharicola TaxID=335842 RepID=A0ABR1W757_9PEZI
MATIPGVRLEGSKIPPRYGTLPRRFKPPVFLDKLSSPDQGYHDVCLARAELERNRLCDVQRSVNSTEP